MVEQFKLSAQQALNKLVSGVGGVGDPGVIGKLSDIEAEVTRTSWEAMQAAPDLQQNLIYDIGVGAAGGAEERIVKIEYISASVALEYTITKIEEQYTYAAVLGSQGSTTVTDINRVVI